MKKSSTIKSGQIKLTLTDEMICKHLEKSIKGFKSLLADIKK